MAQTLVVFVCEGPTCSDRWGSSSPRVCIEEGIRALGIDQRVHVAREICFGRCRDGANLLTCPVEQENLPIAADRPNSALPGAAFHHAVVESDAVRIIKRSVEGLDLGIAANRELA